MISGENSTALITDASREIGAGFACKLATQGHNLILVAWCEGKLQRLAVEPQAQFLTNAETLVVETFTSRTNLQFHTIR